MNYARCWFVGEKVERMLDGNGSGMYMGFRFSN